MENFATEHERLSQSQIDVKQQQCETIDSCKSLNTSPQSSVWKLNKCVSNCCPGSSSEFRSKKFQSTRTVVRKSDAMRQAIRNMKMWPEEFAKRNAGYLLATFLSEFFHTWNDLSHRLLAPLSDISRSHESWHRPLTNCMFDSHFKDINRIDEFQIEHLVAKGAFACVFKVTAKNNSLGQAFALKTIKKSKVIRNNCVKQIKEESDIQKLCGHHPFIVQHFESWQDRRHLYILCEYISNGELFSKISNFTTELIRLYVAEIAIAIDFLHNAGVIYRDAKPENILLTHNFHIKITDFGLSKWLKLGAKTKTMCGTHQYMAPEILRNEPYGHSVDWWALGVIVCEMYTKKGPNVEEIIKSLVSSEANTGSFSIKKFLPEEFECIQPDGRDLLLRLFDINPKTRLHSVMSLQRIAFYKNFKIDKKYVLNVSPMEIIRNENIIILQNSNELGAEVEF